MSIQKILTGGIRGTASPLDKGIAWLDEPVESNEVAQRGWNLLREDLSLPAAVLYEDKLHHNLEWMRKYIAAYGAHLAPHGKTTMAPQLFALQLEAGAWGITLASAQQTRVAYEHGVRRVLMANQLIGKANFSIISHLLRDPEFEFYCLVDSSDQIEQLGLFFAERDQRLNVLIELGVMGGRAGVRDHQHLQAVLDSLEAHRDTITLCGIEIYEGVLSDEGAIRGFLHRAVDTAKEIARSGLFQRTPFILSGAGSAWYDVVADVFSHSELKDAAELVLRPGCYLTHDIGSYRAAQARIQQSDPVAQRMGDGLVPALHVWAYVQSIPEPERVVIGMGKRDVAFDSGFPVPALHFRPSESAPTQAAAHWQISKLMDQHGFLKIAPGDDLRVGDMIGFDIAHPCLTFDKWRVLALVNRQYDVIDFVRTFF